MTCHSCTVEMVKAGKGRNGMQRYKCQQCGKRFQEPQEKPLGADSRLPGETIFRILHRVVEGNSVRGTARLCAVEKRTVLNILTLAGEAFERLFSERVPNVQAKDLERDKIWTFVGCKQKQVPSDRIKGMRGDAYT